MAKIVGSFAAGVLLTSALAAWGTDVTPPSASPNSTAAAHSQNASAKESVAASAEHYVREAMAAEVAGADVKRNELLRQALAADPNCREARWQLGYVSIDGKWLSPEEADRRYSTDRNLAEYRKRRDEAAA
ncbi:MAG TPA: hypothetical protein VKB78_09875, partial [Pirellulales bacterium]|nr:hypothetical protein [Pirellulales bacterium]